MEGKFSYAWDGTELVLLPAVSEDYKNSKSFTQLQGQAVKIKDLIPGATYVTKKQEDLTFVGRFDYHFMVEPASHRHAKKDETGVVKKFVFWNGKQHLYLNELKSIAVLKSDTVAPNFAELVSDYAKSPHGSKAVKLFLKEAGPTKSDRDYSNSPYWYYEETPGVFVECSSHYGYHGGSYDKNKVQYVSMTNKISINNGILVKTAYGAVSYSDGYKPTSRSWQYGYHGYHQPVVIPWVQPTNNRLFAEMESGAKIRFEYGTFEKGR